MTLKKKKKRRKSKSNVYAGGENGTAESGTVLGASASILVPTGSQPVSTSTTPSISAHNTPSGDESGADHAMRTGIVDQDNGLDVDPSSSASIPGSRRDIVTSHAPDRDNVAATELLDDSLSVSSVTESGVMQINPHASLDSWKQSMGTFCHTVGFAWPYELDIWLSCRCVQAEKCCHSLWNAL